MSFERKEASEAQEECWLTDRQEDGKAYILFTKFTFRIHFCVWAFLKVLPLEELFPAALIGPSNIAHMLWQTLQPWCKVLIIWIKIKSQTWHSFISTKGTPSGVNEEETFSLTTISRHLCKKNWDTPPFDVVEKKYIFCHYYWMPISCRLWAFFKAIPRGAGGETSHAADVTRN